MQQTQQSTAQTLSTIQQYIVNKHGKKPTFQQFFNTYLEKFRELHPNSTAPNNALIGMFYDDFLKYGEIIGY